jgi:peptide/nickel transport system substrate-binding protein
MTSNDPFRQPLDRRSFLQRATALGLSLPAGGALLAACGGDEEDAGGTQAATSNLRVRLGTDITTLDPAFFANTSVDEPVMASVFEGLVTYDPHATSFKVVNQLAESFEPSSDGLSFDFTLKQGVPFHGDYGEVTAEDVKFSYERLAGLTKPKIESPYGGDWAALKEVKVKDKYSGTIILKEPFAALQQSTLPVTSGYVVSKKAVEERGKKFGTSPIGTGPYEFTKWTPKQKVELKRFESYGTGFIDPAWTTITFLPIDSDEAGDIALETGEVDFSQLSLQSIDRFEDNDEFETTSRTTLAYIWIGMNVLHPNLKDINVRQAIRYAIDVPSMLEAAFEGRFERANTIIPPDMGLGAWPDAPNYERDVDKAKDFLKQAGTVPAELTFTYLEEPGASEVAEITQANLAEVGIKVRLIKEDEGTYYELGKRLLDRQLFWGDYETQPDPSFSTVWFTCDQFDEWNWMYWCNKRYDELHFAALKESDPEKRSAAYVEMQKVWDEAVHTVWLAWPTKHYAFKKEIEAAITPHGRVLPQAFRPV